MSHAQISRFEPRPTVAEIHLVIMKLDSIFTGILLEMRTDPGSQNTFSRESVLVKKNLKIFYPVGWLGRGGGVLPKI